MTLLDVEQLPQLTKPSEAPVTFFRNEAVVRVCFNEISGSNNITEKYLRLTV
jgi:hypothetical protein